MSITDAFRLLNSNIRGIATDRMRHEEQIANIENRKLEMEATLNSPQARLKRQQAEAELELKPVKGLGYTTAGKSQFEIEAFQNDIVPKMNAISPEGSEVDDKGNLVWAGTEEPFVQPAWQAKKTQAEMGIVFAMAGLPSLASQREMDSLDSKINELTTAKGPKDKLTGKDRLDYINWSQRKAALTAERDDPTVWSKKLMTDNKKLMDNLQVLYTMQGSEKTVTQLQNQLKMNNQMLASMSKEGKFKGKAFNYTTTQGGVTRQQTIYYEPGNEPQQIQIGSSTWHKGTVKAEPGTSDKGKLTAANRNTVLKDFTKFKSVLSAAQVAVNKEQAIQALLTGGHTDDEANKLADLLKTNKGAVVQEYSDLIENYKRRYSGQDFSKGVIWKDDKKKSKGPGVVDETTKGKKKDYSSLW